MRRFLNVERKVLQGVDVRQEKQCEKDTSKVRRRKEIKGP